MPWDAAQGTEEIRVGDDVELLPNGFARNRVGRVVALWSEPITSSCDLKLACIRHYVHPQVNSQQNRSW